VLVVLAKQQVEDQELLHNHKLTQDHKLVLVDKQLTVDMEVNNNNKSQQPKEVLTQICHQ
jgi:hypothetical protein